MASRAPTFAIVEHHGNRSDKTRLSDDFRAIGINALPYTADTDIPVGMDTMSEMTAYYMCVNPRKDLEIRTSSSDFTHAYMQAMLPASNAACAHIALAAPGGAIIVAELRAHPFGSPLAPANWSRGADFAQRILASFLGVHGQVRR